MLQPVGKNESFLSPNGYLQSFHVHAISPANCATSNSGNLIQDARTNFNGSKNITGFSSESRCQGRKGGGL